MCTSQQVTSWQRQSAYEISQCDSVDQFNKTPTTPASRDFLKYCKKGNVTGSDQTKDTFSNYYINKSSIICLIRMWSCQVWVFAWCLPLYVVIAHINLLIPLPLCVGLVSSILERKLFNVSKHIALTSTPEE